MRLKKNMTYTQVKKAIRTMKSDGVAVDDIVTRLNNAGVTTHLGTPFIKRTVQYHLRRKRRSDAKPQARKVIKRAPVSAKKLNAVKAILDIPLSDADKVAHIELLLQ